jgi:hypothetical protein
VSFRWTDRANGGALRVETISGVEFVARYLRHVLPKGMRGVRHCGFCHPAAKAKREKVAFHTGRPLLVGALAVPPPKQPPEPCKCPRCGGAVVVVRRIPAPWEAARARPPPQPEPARPSR